MKNDIYFSSGAFRKKNSLALRYHFVLVPFLFISFFVASQVMAQDDILTAHPEAEHAADVLDPPPLPKLDKGDWASKKTVFADALSVEDAEGNDLDKMLDLPGITYTTHIDKARDGASDEDPIYAVTAAYEQALLDKYFDTRVHLGESPYYLMGPAGDDEDGGVYGQSVIAQGKLRFIAVSDSKRDIEIFISDEMPVPELIQKIEAKDKTKTSGPK